MKERLTSLSEEPHAKGSVQLENEKDYQMKGAFYACPIADFLKRCVPDGSYGKMYLVFSAQMRETTSNCFYKKFRRQGILVHGECWTLDMCEWTDSLAPFLKEDGVYSLSDILERTSDIPQKYYLRTPELNFFIHHASKSHSERELQEIFSNLHLPGN